MRIDLCCIARRENLTIKDWVTYHKNIGINHIWIFDNNNIDDDSLLNILHDLIDDNYVTILNNFKGKTSAQVKAYNYFLDNYWDKNICDFVGFLDCDEYLTLMTHDNVSDYFNDVIKHCPNICDLYINWECYGSNGNYFYEDKPVVERFTLPIGDYTYGENKHIKSFARMGIINNRFGGTSHDCYANGYYVYSDDYQKINRSCFNYNHKPINAKLRHYVTKSLEEWIYRKFGEFTADGHQPKSPREYYWRNPKNDEMMKALKVIEEKYGIKTNMEKC